MLPQQMCLFSEAVSFILFLQGAHGLKGNEGPHGPPGPAVSTTYRIRILSLSLLLSRSHLQYSASVSGNCLHSKVPTLSCSGLLHNIMICTVRSLHKTRSDLFGRVDVPDIVFFTVIALLS